MNVHFAGVKRFDLAGSLLLPSVNNCVKSVCIFPYIEYHIGNETTQCTDTNLSGHLAKERHISPENPTKPSVYDALG